MTIRNWWIFPLILIFSAALFFPSFNYYFFQDDWFVLNWVGSESLFSFFQFRTDIIYYRPLTMPVFFALGKLLFGLNPLGFHLISFMFHILNSILVYFLFRQLNRSDETSKLAAFIYASSAFHFIGLSWLSTSSYIIGTSFILATIISFLKSKFVLAFILFILALISSEFSIICIPLIFLIKKLSHRTLFLLMPYIILVGIYLSVRFLIFPVPATGDYGLSLKLTTITNLVWYFLWTFNFAEKFSTIFFISDLKSFPNLIWSQINYLIFPSILISASSALVVFSKLKVKDIVFGFSWFLVSLSPVILIPKHTYPIYLIISSLGIIYTLISAIEKFKNKQLPVIFIALIWFISSYQTLDFTRKTHWITNQQAISKAYAKFTLEKISAPSEGTIFVFRPADLTFSSKSKFTLVETEDNVKQSLNDQDAVKVIYNDQTLKSVYLTWQQQAKFESNSNLIEIAPK